MKNVTKERINIIVAVVAIAFIKKVEAKEACDNHTETIIDCLETLIRSNEITLSEALMVFSRHEDDIMIKMIKIAHETNSSHDCKSCVLFPICCPDDKVQDEHSVEADLNEFLKFMHNLLDPKKD